MPLSCVLRIECMLLWCLFPSTTWQLPGYVDLTLKSISNLSSFICCNCDFSNSSHNSVLLAVSCLFTFQHSLPPFPSPEAKFYSQNGNKSILFSYLKVFMGPLNKHVAKFKFLNFLPTSHVHVGVSLISVLPPLLISSHFGGLSEH